jgi:ubiquinone/menaquinone biosynthesis C-methylase UbiE
MPVPSGESVLLDADKILSHLKVGEGMRVGELGCGGRGHFVFPAVGLVGSRGHVYAVDVLQPVLQAIERQAREQHWQNVTTVWSNLEVVGATGVPAGTLDRATLINILFQAKDRLAMLNEARRLLKPDGLLLVVDWRRESAPFGPAPARRVPEDEASALATRAGFTLVDRFQAGPHHYGLVCRVH